jgi:hypothetical protein
MIVGQTLVPEPGTIGILIGSAAMTLARRRRRN